MKYKLYLIPALLIILVAGSELYAQKLIIKQLDGAEYAETLSTVKKLYFSGNSLVVDFTSGPDDFYDLQEIRKLYFDAEVSTAENGLVNNLKIYPNPAGNYITIMGLPADAGLLSVYKPDGSLVLATCVISEKETIDIRILPDGLYLLNIKGFTAKFIKK
jgi:hypothetical protein